jgi:hypothetical protein
MFDAKRGGGPAHSTFARAEMFGHKRGEQLGHLVHALAFRTDTAYSNFIMFGAKHRPHTSHAHLLRLSPSYRISSMFGDKHRPHALAGDAIETLLSQRLIAMFVAKPNPQGVLRNGMTAAHDKNRGPRQTFWTKYPMRSGEGAPSTFKTYIAVVTLSTRDSVNTRFPNGLAPQDPEELCSGLIYQFLNVVVYKKKSKPPYHPGPLHASGLHHRGNDRQRYRQYATTVV